MTYYLDTNCILRFITNDVPDQAERIEKRFREASQGKSDFILTHIVLFETLFQLEHWYTLPRIEASNRLMTFLSPDWILTDKKSVILACLEEYKQVSCDFADLYLFHLAKDASFPILSFDKDFDTLSRTIRTAP
jgi:predicted nucleic-acid-binding protein